MTANDRVGLRDEVIARQHTRKRRCSEQWFITLLPGSTDRMRCLARSAMCGYTTPRRAALNRYSGTDRLSPPLAAFPDLDEGLQVEKIGIRGGGMSGRDIGLFFRADRSAPA